MKANQEMARGIDNSGLQGTARQSDPSGGLSAFRGGASVDGTQDAIPAEKFIVGGDSASEALMSQEQQNQDLQGMYDRIMGQNPNHDARGSTDF